MKKFLIGMLCLAVCGGIALTSCAKKEENDEVKVEKDIVLNFTDDYEEPAPVFEYHFSGGEATLVAYHPENAAEGEELPTDIVLPEKPVRIKAETVEEPAVVDDKNVIIKKKVEVADDKEYVLVGIEDGAFAGNTDITSVVIPDTVTAIGTGAFQGCTALKSVTLPASLEKINDFTFNGCSSLEELNIPEGVESVGLFAFGEYFDQIPWYKNLPASSVIVGDGVLLKYKGVAADVVYGKEVKSVAYYAFTDSAATSVTFTNATEDFDTQAFYRSSAVVKLPSNSNKINELKMNSVKVETYEAVEEEVV
ncbi:MAG: leucine-rich repeat domain-containing protein, partial [Clostridia bacterium]|nr:leucine-rich repeat domain-containing protein [Clostridia bacterium]